MIQLVSLDNKQWKEWVFKKVMFAVEEGAFVCVSSAIVGFRLNR